MTILQCLQKGEAVLYTATPSSTTASLRHEPLQLPAMCPSASSPLITSGLRTGHHRDTERTEKKNENYGGGSYACYFLGWNYRYDDYNPESKDGHHGASAHKRNLG